jgi:coenzyme F420 hydrogenase subunit beta
MERFGAIRKVSTIRNVTDLVDWRLCLGCGACAYICHDKKIKLVDFVSEGIRPVVSEGACEDCRECLEVCPVVQTDFSAGKAREDGTELTSSNFQNDWGPILEIWEGHAVDELIRFKGASGGVLTALSAYCLEKRGMYGVLHTAQDPDYPVRNRSRISRTREDLVAATGSRYSPASICDGLEGVEAAPDPCVIIGKPVEIVAVNNARRLRPALDAKIGVTLSFFCAESPSTGGTLALLNRMGVPPDSVSDLRYRGDGWPGHFAPTQKGNREPAGRITYRESWAFLQAYRPWSVHLWPDGTGELADISCGDPWYDEPDGKNPGFSIVVVRTEQGRAIVRGAIDAGYLTLRLAEPWKLAKSQANLLNKKAAVWGRLFAMRICGLPVPRFIGVSLFRCWLKLPHNEKIRSTVGTLRRVLTRKLYKPLELEG